MTPEHPSKGTVLLVEDEASIADLVRLYLERDGFRVVWRTDGPSGLAAAGAEALRRGRSWPALGEAFRAPPDRVRAGGPAGQDEPPWEGD